ncbi:MAG: hypothetical protein QOH61_1895 [Chloroflexota bacterium]|jgi:hypothetical protein|nr:hypothetical protein [Chloroflexota bacterium]
MATTPATGTSAPPRGDVYADDDKGSGWLLFAGIMIVMVGILNVIYGIAAIDNANFFVANQKYILSDLNTWGWVMLVLGALQVVAAFSIWSGGGFGRWFGIGAASLSAIAALMAIPAYPFWSLAVFALDILIIYGLATYGGGHRHSAY